MIDLLDNLSEESRKLAENPMCGFDEITPMEQPQEPDVYYQLQKLKKDYEDTKFKMTEVKRKEMEGTIKGYEDKVSDRYTNFLNDKWRAELNNKTNYEHLLNLNDDVVDEGDKIKIISKLREFVKVINSQKNTFPALRVHIAEHILELTMGIEKEVSEVKEMFGGNVTGWEE